mmetsp:Transcript_2298/g.6707  ORF Transcript_2298/g.6707 Transcript_2298/m.6707 type:complete len:210 (-) Transcript_2298:1288-1917(-)
MSRRSSLNCFGSAATRTAVPSAWGLLRLRSSAVRAVIRGRASPMAAKPCLPAAVRARRRSRRCDMPCSASASAATPSSPRGLLDRSRVVRAGRGVTARAASGPMLQPRATRVLSLLSLPRPPMRSCAPGPADSPLDRSLPLTSRRSSAAATGRKAPRSRAPAWPMLHSCSSSTVRVAPMLGSAEAMFLAPSSPSGARRSLSASTTRRLW